ncbi:hypothetical protein [Rickettsia rhipicephali]|uniref:hypothetical protein n=1 Tax=Rickettsia rhipicephali TaxID=33992 RepID=UPI00224E7E0C|nr:hypothetical protein [Rickettsia rhipicephali]
MNNHNFCTSMWSFFHRRQGTTPTSFILITTGAGANGAATAGTAITSSASSSGSASKTNSATGATEATAGATTTTPP